MQKLKHTKSKRAIEAIGNRVVVSISLYHDAIGLSTTADYFLFSISRSDWKFDLRYGSDGLFIHDGVAWNEVGTNLVVQDTWQEWTFDIDLSAGVASADRYFVLGNQDNFCHTLSDYEKH